MRRTLISTACAERRSNGDIASLPPWRQCGSKCLRSGSTPFSGRVSSRSSRSPSHEKNVCKMPVSSAPARSRILRASVGRTTPRRASGVTNGTPARQKTAGARRRPLDCRDLPVDVVAAEALVAAVPRQRDRHMAAHRGGDPVYGEQRRIGKTAERPPCPCQARIWSQLPRSARRSPASLRWREPIASATVRAAGVSSNSSSGKRTLKVRRSSSEWRRL